MTEYGAVQIPTIRRFLIKKLMWEDEDIPDNYEVLYVERAGESDAGYGFITIWFIEHRDITLSTKERTEVEK